MLEFIQIDRLFRLLAVSPLALFSLTFRIILKPQASCQDEAAGTPLLRHLVDHLVKTIVRDLVSSRETACSEIAVSSLLTLSMDSYRDTLLLLSMYSYLVPGASTITVRSITPSHPYRLALIGYSAYFCCMLRSGIPSPLNPALTFPLPNNHHEPHCALISRSYTLFLKGPSEVPLY
ncbi:hypothetical protein BDR22DRAFT_195426 [Usnea florida]